MQRQVIVTSGYWAIIGFLGAAQALAVGLALATSAGVRRRLLGALLMTLGATMGVITLSHMQPAGEPLALRAIELVLSLLAPVLFLAFVTLTVRGEERMGRLRWHFLLPALATVLGGLLAFGVLDSRFLPSIGWVVLLQMSYTATAAWRVFGRHASARADPGELRLARLSTGLFVLIHAAQICRFFTAAQPWREIVPITAAGAVFALTFLAARSSRIFETTSARESRDEDSSTAKYRGSSLTREHAERGLERLRHALEDERAFLRADLSLVQLASELGLARTHLSQLVNEHCGQSFQALLAEHRVAEAKRLLDDPRRAHLTVEAIAAHAGFQSRSAFYTAFKRRTGLTPSAYRRRAAPDAP